MSDEQQPENVNDQIEERRRALEQIIELGFDPYPHRFDRTHSISQIEHQLANKTGEELEAERPGTRVAGRVHAKNKKHKAPFIRIAHRAQLHQIYIKTNQSHER